MRTLSLILRYNLRSLSVRGTDALMTLFGIALCATVVVVVAALDRGISLAFQASGNPDVALLLRKGAPTEVQGRLELETVNLARSLEGIAGELSREIVVLMTLPRRADRKPSSVLVRGIDAPGIALRPAFKLTSGRLPSPNAAEVLVARRTADRIEGLGLGETFAFGKFRFNVVGLFEAGGTSDSEVWGPTPQVQAAFDRGDGFSSIRVKLAGATPGERAQSRASLEVQLDANPRLPLRVLLETEYYASQESSAADLPKVLGKLLAVFMAIGAGFGSMNTMYGRVASRTREVATLRALGYGKLSVVSAFVFESMALGLIGGGLGVLLALPVDGYTSATTALSTMSEVSFAFQITREGIVAAMVLSAVVGLFGGLFPALAAANRAIPEALRDS